MSEPSSANSADRQPLPNSAESASVTGIVAAKTASLGMTTPASHRKWRTVASYLWPTVIIGGLVVAVLVPPVMQAREAARRTSCNCQLKQIGLALHNYHDVYRTFPPAFVRGPDGRPWHSWRVLILPYIDQATMYKQYNFAEPWDGPNNRKLLANMPVTFVCPSRRPCSAPAVAASISSGLLACIDHSSPRGDCTSYAAVLGPNCVFRGAQPTTLRDLTDGTSNTILIGECSRTRIPWTKPEDIDITQHPQIGDPDGFSSYHKGGCQFLIGDGTVRFLNVSIPQATLDALYTSTGGETVGILNLP